MLAPFSDTKVAGGLALWEAAKNDALGTFLMYGSWAGRFGNAHQSDYSAANHLLGRLASVLCADRPDVRVITLDLPPWEDSGMVNALPEPVRRVLSSRVRFLNDETGLAHVLAELGAEGRLVRLSLVLDWRKNKPLTVPSSRFPERNSPGWMITGLMAGSSCRWQSLLTTRPLRRRA